MTTLLPNLLTAQLPVLALCMMRPLGMMLLLPLFKGGAMGSALIRNSLILMFALPGAFTPTCSAQHVPGFVKHHDAIMAKGVDDVWCVAVNDAFVMGAWGREQHSDGKVRMLGDGSGHWTKAMGLELDLTARNMGVRSQRYAAIIDNGVIKALEVEAPGKFEVSSAEAMIKHL